MNNTGNLIDELASRAAPVKPIGSPLARTSIWLASAFAIIALVVASHGLRAGLADEFSLPMKLMEWIASVATGVAAAYAVFHVSVPGRSQRWFYLPFAPFALWLATLCWACVLEYRHAGSAALAYESASWECAAAITAMSLPLGLFLLLMVRHAGVVSPVRTALMAAMSAATLSASGVTLFHSGETALMVLLWHVGAVALLCVVSRMLGRKMFAWLGPSTSATWRS